MRAHFAAGRLGGTSPGIGEQSHVRRTHLALRLALHPFTVRVEIPRLAVVFQTGLEQAAQTLLKLWRLDGDRRFDAPQKVARHPVGGADVELVAAGVVKVPDARVLEEPADDARDAD